MASEQAQLRVFLRAIEHEVQALGGAPMTAARVACIDAAYQQLMSAYTCLRNARDQAETAPSEPAGGASTLDDLLATRD
ncbi:hypothetical protein [Deinococcus maricopensis]|uniref:Uncharacterized protein n=1 Tax=Deinococcus maricopensis (strain DSM 21211 / LMG 22137 / NRRL B-23946 / LB-34) TaxID=709986 RepID=E8U4A0_DEIML|nr:hypothetical protein [Deinococcus maricopensis]ADV65937.1 hypothetical protein Deima_0275 [Deinococcus maricopensis DSM 21211]